MSLLIFAFVVILILCLVWWIVQSMPMGDARLKWALQAIAAIIAVLAIANRAGVV